MNKIISVGRYEGKYDLCHPGQIQANWEIRGFPEESGHKNISITMEIGCDYDCERERNPWEVAANIKNWYEKKVLCSGNKERDLKAIQWLFDNRASLEIEWNKNEVEILSARIRKLEKERDEILSYINDLELDLIEQK